MELLQYQKDVLGKMLSGVSLGLGGGPGGGPGLPGGVAGFGTTGAGAGVVGRPDSALIWKILVYDTHGRDILAPLFTIGELKRLGVTLHLLITERRERVADVPAVYFVRPTLENIQLIVRDIQRQLYDDVYLNFTSTISSDLLDVLAEAVAQAEASGVSIRVGSVADQLADFISEAPKLVSLGHEQSYNTLFGPLTPDSERERYVMSVVDGLFCICATLGVAPIIRAPSQGSPATMIAELLTERLRKAIADTPRMFSASEVGATGMIGSKSTLGTGASSVTDAGAARSHRPILILVDRQFDMATPLHHPRAFHALLSDVLGLRGNRVSYLGDDGKMENVDIDLQDEFWINNASKSMDVVAENVAALISDYKRCLEEVQRATGKGAGELAEMLSGNAGGAASLAELSVDSQGTASMESVVEAVPKLVRRKKNMTTHTNLGGALTAQIRSRSLGEVVLLEEAVLAGERIDKNQLLKLIKEGKANLADKTRLLLVCFFSPNSFIDNALFSELSGILMKIYGEKKTANKVLSPLEAKTDDSQLGEEASSDPYDFHFDLPKALTYAKHLRADQNMAQVLGASGGASRSGQGAGQSGEGGMLGSLAQLVIDHSTNIYSSIRRAVSDSADTPLIRLTSALVSNERNVHGGTVPGGLGAGSHGQGTSSSVSSGIPSDSSIMGADFVYFDPRLPRGTGAGGSVTVSHRNTSPFRQAIVFVVGPGCLHEYYALQDLAQRRSSQSASSGTTSLAVTGGFGQSCSIAYGCSELQSPNELLEQLTKL